jgi:hypothetical protein
LNRGAVDEGFILYLLSSEERWARRAKKRALKEYILIYSFIIISLPGKRSKKKRLRPQF